MRWHSTRLQRGAPMKGVDGLWYFIVSNVYASAGRRYAVCTYDAATNEVETIGAGSLQHATLGQARRAMVALVSGAK